MTKRITLLLLTVMVAVASCSHERDLKKAFAAITTDELREHTRILASDSMMGRKPFTGGERLTTGYLARQLEKRGFRPVFGDSWFQEVPMTEITSIVEGAVTFTAGERRWTMSPPDEIALKSPSMSQQVTITDMPVIFCGFGIVAPEYGWDDYAGLEVKDKCVVVLINDPGLYSGDTTLFRGRAMTYYGRWTYKYEEAARQGAAAVLIIHESTGAGYDYSIPRKSSISPSLYMKRQSGEQEPCQVTGWINAGAAEKLFSSLGHDLDGIRSAAATKGYRGFDTGTTITLTINNSHVENSSVNVAGILEGRKRPEEAVVISAHWDHFGIGEPENGDSIYNGAVDNGTAMAWALGIGKGFASLKKRTERSVIIVFPTAEEQGLLGSSWFVANPPVKTENIIACFNNDLMLPIGRMRDVMITGYGQSELDDLTAKAAERQGRYIMPDPNPETGMYFRSDHFPFAAIGVPALFARGNCDSREHGEEWARQQEEDYLRYRYHKPADNYYPEMNFEGIAEDAEMIMEVAYMIVNSRIRPQWKAGSEFIKER